ncbi:sensor histidine kinase [Tenacibaculum holothuriorum]|uniref:sensor histidine kinase n=1 Tax=Tenacibaculum holothuriorum TaxID=1635173 RepID=UPI000A328635|nr:histidine kinase [Tenacibaculum holothuriorum]
MQLLDITSAFYSWIRGGLVMLFVYHFIIYLQSRDKIHKYYTGYLFCLTVYLVRDAFPNPTVQEFYKYISFSIQYVGYVYFIHFARSLVNSKVDFPKLDFWVVRLSQVMLLFAAILVGVQFVYGYEVQKKVVAYSVPFSSICGLVVFYLISKKRTTEVFYLLLGSILFLIFANISSIKMIKGEYYLIDFKVHRMFYYFVGALIQSTIFAVLTGNYFSEIAEKKREMEVSLLRKEHQISELKLTALKSQMNPHFLFNSLNSINNYVIQNKIELASDFITKFSSLVRKVLQATNKNSITLQEELDMLAIYVKLEQMRLKNNFIFTKKIDENINVESLKVVPLFLQPFVENAIWHGLTLKEGDKKLDVSISKKNDAIEVKIIDNGIGVEESKKRKQKSNVKRKSYGISIVKERLRIMYQPQKTFIKIKEINENASSGTMVTITFPYVE